MKSRSYWLVSIVLFGLGAVAAQAQYYYAVPAGEGPYFSVDLGPSFFQDGRLTQFGGPAGSPVRYDTGFTAQADFGYAFNPNISAGFALGVVGAQIDSVPGYVSDDSHLYNVPFLAKATFSFPLPRSPIVPYIGGGVGFAATVFDTAGFGNDFDVVSGSESDVVPAGELFAGLRYQLTPAASVGVGYQFFATGDPTFTYPPDNFHARFNGVRTHTVLFTFQVSF